MTNSEIIMICLTAVIAAAGVVGACIFNNQLSVMQGQLNEMKTAGEDTKLAANAAVDAVRLAENTALRQLRAYIVADPTNLLFNNGQRLEVKFSIRNIGQTPAQDVNHSALIAVLPYPLSPNFTFPVLPAKGPHSLILGKERPYDGRAFTVNIIQPSDIQFIDGTNTKSRFYVFGIITYDALFYGKGETLFCFSVVPNAPFAAALSKPGGVIGGSIEFEPANQHNSLK